jgi:integrase/recombinase XerD
LKSPKVTPEPTLPFSKAEVEKLVKACDRFNGNGARLRAMILILRYSGLRISDAVALTRDRIVDGKLFLYTQKTGTPVYVPLPKKVTEALAGTGGEKYFFWSGNGKLKSATEDWRRSLLALAELANVEEPSFHRLRDTFAVELLLAGVPIDQVSILLGHSSVKVTEKHYAPWVKARQQQLEAAVKKAW